MPAKNVYVPGKEYGPYTILKEVGTKFYNHKMQPAFEVVCLCGAEYIKSRSQLADSQRRGYIHCNKCKEGNGGKPKNAKTTIPGEVPDIGKLFIAGRV